MSVDRGVPGVGAELGRRTIIMLLGVLVIGAPAVVLRLTCVGHSCDRPTEATATIPFCSLPGDLRASIAAGFREGRSPDVFGVTGRTPVRGGTALERVVWPSTAVDDASVPLVFAGGSIDGSADLPDGARLDRVAPTIATAIGLDRPHPEVRSGTALPLEFGAPPALVLEVVLKGIGSRDIAASAMPVLDDLMERGAATATADPGSEPLDSAAILTTIGTGGLPAQHGITGSLMRDDRGDLVRAWSEGSPPSVIAGLGDDLDEYNAGTPRVGLVASRAEDRGLIGGTWYLGAGDDDDVRITKDASGAVEELLEFGYGADEEPDLLAVALAGNVTEMDRTLGEIVAAANRASNDRLLVVVTATGRANAGAAAVPWSEVAADLDRAIGAPVTEAVAPGGIYVDQAVIAREQITERQITNAMLEMEASDGGRLLADAFPAIAISFLRYC